MDDVPLTLTDPMNSRPAFIDCVEERYLGPPTEIMFMVSCGHIEPGFVKPFDWAPAGFNYLGISHNQN